MINMENSGSSGHEFFCCVCWLFVCGVGRKRGNRMAKTALGEALYKAFEKNRNVKKAKLVS